MARAKGYDCDYRALRIADLHAAQGIWLVSSMTLAARVHTLDGRRLPRFADGRGIRRTGRRRDRQRSLSAEFCCGLAQTAGTVGRTQGRRWSAKLIASWTCEVATR